MDQAVAGVSPQISLSPIGTLGARPLRNPRHERFARARSLLVPKSEAYRRAFDLVEAQLDANQAHAVRGNASKLERKQQIADRITWLCRQDEEVLAEKRRRLEEFLWLVHESDPGELWEIAEREKTDAEGDAVLSEAGDPVMVRYQRLKFMVDLPEDVRRTVESIKYTESGRPQVSTYSKMQANQELRKLLGIGATRDDFGNSEFDRMSDDQLFSELERLANELGVPVTLRIGAGA